MSGTVSVVIPTYNYGQFIGEALDSALRQTLAPVEVIVVDDGSTDDTEQIVGEFANRSVRYIRQENAGVCSARNRGAAESTGDLIAFLDADDTWEPTKLAKQADRFDDPNIGLVHCGMTEFDSASGEIVKIHNEGGELGVAENLLLWEGPVIVGPGGTIMVARRVFDAIGGFDTRMKCGEDWDLCYRIAREYKVAFVAEPLVNYRSHGAAAHHNIDNMECGMAMFYEKAFDTQDPNVLALKDRALGNYHKVMSGSYFRAGRLGKFASHAVRSIARRPANISYFLGYPLRRLR
ncbi:MAG: glycosyltransferase family A protein [Pyrinomonadaceae bacterium]